VDRLTGWKQIAAYLQFGVRWCRRLSKQSVNPLPTYRLGGPRSTVLASRAALAEWESREAARQGSPIPRMVPE
jgi:hypothetical protein